MNNKFLFRSIVLALGLTFTTSYGGSIISANSAKSSADFTDLKDLDAATKAKFDAMISSGIFNGISDTTFGLKDEMNRAQFAKVAALITGIEVNKDLKTSSFSDVTANDAANGYALPYIEALKNAGITEGYGEGTYNPAGKVTKEQLATFLVRVLGKDADAKAMAAPGIADPSVSDWAKDYVALALQLKLLPGTSASTFGGKIPADRELLAGGAFASAKTLEESQPLFVEGGHFEAADKLNLKLTVRIDPKSIDLSKIKINGIPLDAKLDSFVLSEDGKTITIKLHTALPFNDSSKMPLVDISNLLTLYGNSVHNDESNPIPVTAIESLVTKPKTTTPSTSEPATNSSSNDTTKPSTSEPTTNPNPNESNTPSTEEPVTNPNPNPNSNESNTPSTEEPVTNPNPNPNAGT